VKDGAIVTPEGRNILRGVSRAYVIEELAQELGIEIVEKNIEPYDVYTADEAFMTGTPFCMLPVTQLNGTPIGNGEVGEIFGRVIDRWSKNLGVDIAGQIQQWEQTHPRQEADDAPTPYSFKSK